MISFYPSQTATSRFRFGPVSHRPQRVTRFLFTSLRRGDVVIDRLHELHNRVLAHFLVSTLHCGQGRPGYQRDFVAIKFVEGEQFPDLP